MTERIEISDGVTAGDVRVAKEHLRACPNRHEGGTIGGCTSYIQRKMRIGYNHAARIMEYLESENFISAPNDRGNRRIISTTP